MTDVAEFQNHFTKHPDDCDAALRGTLEAALGLRNERLREDPESREGLLLGQVTLILQRLQHNVPSGRENFTSLLRAAGLAEEKPVRERIEVTP